MLGGDVQAFYSSNRKFMAFTARWDVHGFRFLENGVWDQTEVYLGQNFRGNQTFKSSETDMTFNHCFTVSLNSLKLLRKANTWRKMYRLWPPLPDDDFHCGAIFQPRTWAKVFGWGCTSCRSSYRFKFLNKSRILVQK